MEVGSGGLFRGALDVPTYLSRLSNKLEPARLIVDPTRDHVIVRRHGLSKMVVIWRTWIFHLHHSL